MAEPPDDPRPHWWLLPRGEAKAADLTLPTPFFQRYNKPQHYDPGPELISAVNIALMLGQPLLLTGDPGSGKTSLAYWLAFQMELEKPLAQVVKSSTTGKDLLYSFDELARFRDAQDRGVDRRPQQEYLELSALGLAILFSAGPDGKLDRTGEHAPGGMARPVSHSDLHAGAFPARRRQVVLIDELDKAPRDTPNDLLSEIERMEFSIPEAGVVVRGDPAHRPVVVITSNSDKSLPDPFLRRCVYYNIPPATPKRRREIVERQQPALLKRPELYHDAMATFDRIDTGIGRDGRRPGAAELLAWLDAVDTVYRPGTTSITSDMKAFGVTLAALAKTMDDRELIVRKLGLDRKQLGFA
jgi:MoxR-like ATPase